VVLLFAAACGTDVPHSDIVAAARGSAIVSSGGSPGAPASGGAGTPTPTTLAGAAGAGVGTGPATGSAPSSPVTTSPGSGAATSPGAPSAAAPGPANPNLSTVVLGNIGSYSGVLGAIFPGGAAAMEAWAQYANAHGGLNGHPVKVVVGDDGGDPAQALSLAKQMVQSDGAIGLVGSMVPLSFEGIQPYIDQNHIPLIGGDVTLPAWIQDPDVFPQGTDVASISKGAVQLITSGGLGKLAILYCGESPSCKGLADGASASPPPGVKVVYTAEISIVQTDFTTECLQAKSDGAQAIFVAADSNSVIRVAQSCAQQQYNPRYGTASIAVGPQLASAAHMNGLIAPVNNAPWFLNNTAGTSAFAQAMASYAPGAPLAATAMSMFASGLLVQQAASHFDAHPTSAELLAGLDAIRNSTVDGLSPPLTFTPGRGTGSIPCYFVVQVENGQWAAPQGATPRCA
jgi:branched-chain amino acid transport system substrate-binding protein